jgi:hypothetical protein
MHPCYFHISLEIPKLQVISVDFKGVYTACLILYELASTHHNVMSDANIAKESRRDSLAIIWYLYSLRFPYFVLTIIVLNLELIFLELESLDFIPLVDYFSRLLLSYGNYFLEFLGSSDIILFVL